MTNQKKFYETEEFNRLNKEWQMKLKEEGFTDIEKKDTNGITQPQVFYTQRKQKSPEYWLLVEAILANYLFKRDTDKVVMQLHLERKSLREIAKHLQQDTNLKALTFKSVDRLIKRTIADYMQSI
jgi:hypothetical protein